MAPQNLGAEARALLDVLTQRLEQAAVPPDPSETHDAARCTGCPICAALTYLHDHRELSSQLASGALLMVSALRQYLDGQYLNQSTAGPSAPATTVQHIDIS